MNEFLIEKARKHVKNIFTTNYNEKLTFHSFDHTKEIVEKALEISKGNNLSELDTEIVILASWFHDTGYLFQNNDHESISAKLATQFLISEKYPLENITVVTNCIMATKVNYSPLNLMEKIIRDADMAHLGGEDYYKQSKLLRIESVNLGRNAVPDKEWFNGEINFLTYHEYHTEFAQKKFAEQKAENLRKLKKKLRKLEEEISLSLITTETKEKPVVLDKKIPVESTTLTESKAKELKAEKEKAKKESAAYKSFDSMFKLTSSNHMRLSAMADRKANIMLSLSAVITSISLTKFLPSIQDDNSRHILMIPIGILLISCLITIVFATLSTRPKINRTNFDRSDIDSKKANLFFFGNFSNMNLDDFDYGMNRLMKDQGYIHNSMINDFYFLGKALTKKFRYLQICFNVFMYGIIVSVLSFLIIYFVTL